MLSSGLNFYFKTMTLPITAPPNHVSHHSENFLEVTGEAGSFIKSLRHTQNFEKTFQLKMLSWASWVRKHFFQQNCKGRQKEEEGKSSVRLLTKRVETIVKKGTFHHFRHGHRER